LKVLRAKHAEEPNDVEPNNRLDEDWSNFVSSVRIRIGTLLKTDTVSFLLGAGTSVECGGVLIGAIPLEVERSLLRDGVSGESNPRVRAWFRISIWSVIVSAVNGCLPVSISYRTQPNAQTSELWSGPRTARVGRNMVS